MRRRKQQAPDTPRVVIRRRPSDFVGGGQYTMQMGTTCCCCCCAHWVAAGVGGTWAIVSAWGEEQQRSELGTHPLAKRYVLTGIICATVGTTLLVVACIILLNAKSRAVNDLSEKLLAVLAFLPFLALVPVQLAAIAGGLLARFRLRAAAVDEGYDTGLRLAWRIVWKSLLWASFGTGIGYLLIWLFFLVVDF